VKHRRNRNRLPQKPIDGNGNGNGGGGLFDYYHDLEFIPAQIRQMRVDREAFETDRDAYGTIPIARSEASGGVADPRPALNQPQRLRRTEHSENAVIVVSNGGGSSSSSSSSSSGCRLTSRSFRLTRSRTSNPHIALERMYVRLLYSGVRYDLEAAHHKAVFPTTSSEDYRRMQLSLSEAVELLEWVWGDGQFFPGGSPLPLGARADMCQRLVMWATGRGGKDDGTVDKLAAGNRGPLIVTESWFTDNLYSIASASAATATIALPFTSSQPSSSPPPPPVMSSRQPANNIDLSNIRDYGSLMMSFESFSQWFLQSCLEINRLLGLEKRPLRSVEIGNESPLMGSYSSDDADINALHALDPFWYFTDEQSGQGVNGAVLNLMRHINVFGIRFPRDNESSTDG
jgi:hypothetical protein